MKIFPVNDQSETETWGKGSFFLIFDIKNTLFFAVSQ